MGLSRSVFWLVAMILLTLVRVFAWTPELVWISPFENFGAMSADVLASGDAGLLSSAFIARMTRSSL
jgi:hypothetical protein